MGIVAIGNNTEHDRTPEIVTDPLAENVAYYIVGRTMEGTTPLSGVTISVDGQESVETDNSGLFRISVSGKQTYTVKATKDNYLGMTATPPKRQQQHYQPIMKKP